MKSSFFAKKNAEDHTTRKSKDDVRFIKSFLENIRKIMQMVIRTSE
jgi:hypothetical protein